VYDLPPRDPPVAFTASLLISPFICIPARALALFILVLRYLPPQATAHPQLSASLIEGTNLAGELACDLRNDYVLVS
jgi:hypothetical protein